MDVEFEKSRNELLKRTNVFVKIRSAKTPSKSELKTKISSVLACDESLVVVDKIVQDFGSKISNAYVKIYDDMTSLKEIELDHNKREILKQEKEKEEALKKEREEKKKAKEETKEEAKEDAKEEAKEETKEEVKEDTKEEVKEEAKEDTKEEAKEETKEDKKEEK